MTSAGRTPSTPGAGASWRATRPAATCRRSGRRPGDVVEAELVAQDRLAAAGRPEEVVGAPLEEAPLEDVVQPGDAADQARDLGAIRITPVAGGALGSSGRLIGRAPRALLLLAGLVVFRGVHRGLRGQRALDIGGACTPTHDVALRVARSPDVVSKRRAARREPATGNGRDSLPAGPSPRRDADATPTRRRRDAPSTPHAPAGIHGVARSPVRRALMRVVVRKDAAGLRGRERACYLGSRVCVEAVHAAGPRRTARGATTRLPKEG